MFSIRSIRRGLGVAAAVVAAVLGLALLVAPVVRAAGPCDVAYRVNQWSDGFTATVELTSNAAPLSGWTLTWTFGGDQRITSAWNSQVSQTGTRVTAVNASHNGAVPAGGTVSFGFQAAYSGVNNPPTDFAVNGVSCAGGTTTPTPTPTTGAPPACTGVIFCDGFENQTGTTPSGRWAVVAPNCAGTGAVSVDTTVAHAGTRSVRVNGGGGFCNHVFIADTTDLTASQVWFARLWVRHSTALPGGHITFLAMNDAAGGNTDLRMGGQNGALMWNRQTDDATLPDQSPTGVANSVALPVNTWTCVEFGVNGTTGQIDTWVGGSPVPGMTVTRPPTPNVNDQWLNGAGATWHPRLTDLKLGWESYADQTDTLWYDDVALASTRIGCG